MTLKCIMHKKTTSCCHQKGPPFDIKHQLISSDPFLAVKTDLKWTTWFSGFFWLLLQTLEFVCKTFFFQWFLLRNQISKDFWLMRTIFGGFGSKLCWISSIFLLNCRKIGKTANQGFFTFFGQKLGLMAKHGESTKIFLISYHYFHHIL